jgi:hypothetical protein
LRQSLVSAVLHEIGAQKIASDTEKLGWMVAESKPSDVLILKTYPKTHG